MTQDVYFIGCDDTIYHHERIPLQYNPYLFLHPHDIFHDDNFVKYEYLYKEFGDRGQHMICRVKLLDTIIDTEDTDNNEKPIENMSYMIQGNSDWVKTPFYLHKDNQYTFSMSGSIEYDNKQRYSSPEGLKWSSEDDLYPHLPHCCLVGGIGDTKTVFNLGEYNNITFSALVDGYLFLCINDRWKEGNVGSYTITLQQ